MSKEQLFMATVMALAACAATAFHLTSASAGVAVGCVMIVLIQLADGIACAIRDKEEK